MSATSRPGNGLLLAAGVLGLAVFGLLYRRAFPEAAVPVKVTRPEAVQAAREFLTRQGADLSDFREAEQFGGDDLALVFLQRTLGLDSTSRWARERVPIWTWNVRWFKPLQKEEWRASLGLDGRLARFAHVIEEAAPGADLPQDSARALAEGFVAERGWNLAGFDRVESSTQKRDHRTDHHFAWEQHGSTIAWQGTSRGGQGGGAQPGGTGAIRVAVDVQGSEVGSYRHFVKVPEAFERDFEGTTSVGQLLAIASLGLTFVLVLIALAVSITRHRTNDVRWRPAFFLAGLVSVLAVVQGALSWPVARYSYATQLPWVAFVGILVAGLLFIAVVYGLWTLFPIAAGESLSRGVFPDSVAGFLDAARGRLLSPEMARAGWQGYAVGFGILGYLTLFYFVARRYLGAWLPAEGPYSEIFNVYLPFLAPLTISLVAAVTEETTYRLFGISLCKRYLKSTALALLVPAVIWAFGHSNYPVFPVYLRGIELTIGGVLFGLAFLRLGLLACIVAHFVIDAVQIGMPLLTSGNATYLVSGVIVMGIALAPALLAWIAGRQAAGPAEA